MIDDDCANYNDACLALMAKGPTQLDAADDKDPADVATEPHMIPESAMHVAGAIQDIEYPILAIEDGNVEEVDPDRGSSAPKRRPASGAAAESPKPKR